MILNSLQNTSSRAFLLFCCWPMASKENSGLYEDTVWGNLGQQWRSSSYQTFQFLSVTWFYFYKSAARPGKELLKLLFQGSAIILSYVQAKLVSRWKWKKWIFVVLLKWERNFVPLNMHNQHPGENWWKTQKPWEIQELFSKWKSVNLFLHSLCEGQWGHSGVTKDTWSLVLVDIMSKGAEGAHKWPYAIKHLSVHCNISP